MSEAQDGLPDGNAGPGEADVAPDNGFAGSVPDGRLVASSLEDDATGFGGHTLLSRHSLPQGRRSLFRS